MKIIINKIEVVSLMKFSLIILFISYLFISCSLEKNKKMNSEEINAEEILNNPEYLAISYGGYRQNTRDIQPTIDELKEDLQVLSSIGIKILRTYNLQLDQAPNILKLSLIHI